MEMNIKEVQVPVPWGFIAAKTWGNESNEIVLAIHGWADNANSYNTLIPLLPVDYYYFCLDLPSHGKSTHLQSTLFLNQLDYVIVLKFVCEYLKRGKYILMAHSMGGFISTAFTQLYPEYVAKLIVFDVFTCYPNSAKKFYTERKEQIDKRFAFLMKNNHNKAAPCYTKEEAIKRIIIGRQTPISRKSAEILLERGSELTANGYRFTVAQSVKLLLKQSYTLEYMLELTKAFPIRCPHLVIISSNSSFILMPYKYIDKEYSENGKYEMHVVAGNHDVHLEDPEQVAPIVTEFLSKYNQQQHKL